MIRLTIAVLISLASIAEGQTVTIYFHPMPIQRVRPSLWLTAKEVADVQVTFPGEKKIYRLKRGADDKGQATIPPTYSRGIVRRAVDPCLCNGTLDDGSQFSLALPREPVRGRIAISITCTGTITRPIGQVYAMTVRIPACITRWDGLGKRMADAVTATGVIRKAGE